MQEDGLRYGKGSTFVSRQWFLKRFLEWWSEDIKDDESDLSFYLRGKQRGTSDWTGFFGSWLFACARLEGFRQHWETVQRSGGRLDYTWFAPGSNRPVVAIEHETIVPSKDTLAADLSKFKESHAKVWALVVFTSRPLDSVLPGLKIGHISPSRLALLIGVVPVKEGTRRRLYGRTNWHSFLPDWEYQKKSWQLIRSRMGD